MGKITVELYLSTFGTLNHPNVRRLSKVGNKMNPFHVVTVYVFSNFALMLETDVHPKRFK